MNIAIVEDMDHDYTLLKDILEQNELCKKIGININRFTDGESFLSSFHSDKYQILFLDMILQTSMTGMDIAREVRKTAKNLPIVFTTGESSFALEGYEVHAMDYLLKPYTAERVYSCIERVFSEGSVKVYINIQVDRENVRFPVDELMWAASANHSVEVYLSDGKYLKSYITFDAFQKLLPKNSSFVNCSRGIIVNLNYVDFTDNGDFVLTNGTKVPVSRAKKQQMQALFNEYQISITRGV